jgi:peptide methionine sulfoxide reductase MsrA
MTCDPQQAEHGKLADLLNCRHNSAALNRAGNDVYKYCRSGVYNQTDEQKQVPSLFLSADLGSIQTLASQPVVQLKTQSL